MCLAVRLHLESFILLPDIVFFFFLPLSPLVCLKPTQCEHCLLEVYFLPLRQCGIIYNTNKVRKIILAQNHSISK